MAEAHLALAPEKVAEISLVDLAYLILKTTNKPYNYRDLMQEVARIKSLSEEEVNTVIARLYTEINIDGRFICIGSNVWGLKRWYPTDKQAAEKAAGGKKFVRKDIDEDDDFYDDEDDDFVEEDLDDEPFAAYGEDDEEAVDEEAAEEFDDEDADLAEEEEEAGEADAEEDELDSYDEEDEDF